MTRFVVSLETNTPALVDFADALGDEGFSAGAIERIIQDSALDFEATGETEPAVYDRGDGIVYASGVLWEFEVKIDEGRYSPCCGYPVGDDCEGCGREVAPMG